MKKSSFRNPDHWTKPKHQFTRCPSGTNSTVRALVLHPETFSSSGSIWRGLQSSKI